MGSDLHVLLLQEVRYHPESYLTRLTSMFEVTSIVNIRRKEELRKLNSKPLFNKKYLVLFDDLEVFESNKSLLSYTFMVPVVHVEHKSQLEDAKFICNGSDIPFKVYVNEFTRPQAMRFMQSQAKSELSDAVCKAIIRQTGLSPLRILVAIAVLEQVGYSESNVQKYVDKWVYPDIRSLIMCLLGYPITKKAYQRLLAYLHTNRHWYRYIKKNILDELDSVLTVYRDKIEGKIEDQMLFEYVETTRISRARVTYALRLFNSVSIVSVFALREFIKSASLMEVVLRLEEED